jgi:hypothetical protein
MIRLEHGLLTVKELAAALGRSRTYVEAMKKQGFPMPGRTATLAEARAWLATHPPPRAGEVRRTPLRLAA